MYWVGKELPDGGGHELFTYTDDEVWYLNDLDLDPESWVPTFVDMMTPEECRGWMIDVLESLRMELSEL